MLARSHTNLLSITIYRTWILSFTVRGASFETTTNRHRRIYLNSKTVFLVLAFRRSKILDVALTEKKKRY
jgi:hypothetical protein